MNITILIITILIFLLFVGGLSVGIAFGRHPPKGKCPGSDCECEAGRPRGADDHAQCGDCPSLREPDD